MVLLLKPLFYFSPIAVSVRGQLNPLCVFGELESITMHDHFWLLEATTCDMFERWFPCTRWVDTLIIQGSIAWLKLCPFIHPKKYIRLGESWPIFCEDTKVALVRAEALCICCFRLVYRAAVVNATLFLYYTCFPATVRNMGCSKYLKLVMLAEVLS